MLVACGSSGGVGCLGAVGDKDWDGWESASCLEVNCRPAQGQPGSGEHLRLQGPEVHTTAYWNIPVVSHLKELENECTSNRRLEVLKEYSSIRTICIHALSNFHNKSPPRFFPIHG